MNYLAHAFLADETDEYLIGSFIGDFIKGTIGNRYSHDITKGIMLHRKVDVFADSHALSCASRDLFAGPRRRYAGIILDICYDHFLARHWSKYADSKLSEFVSRVYQLLEAYRYVLPERLQTALPRLFKENWLESYLTLKGVEFSLERISKRLRHEAHLDKSMQEIKLNYEILEHNFSIFFPELIGFTREWMDYSN
jgi:acyl carrier protein phosphodiesterase